jgi:polysaccharide biosynthesis transport protein
MPDKNLVPLNDNGDSVSDALVPASVGQHGNGEWDGGAPALLTKPAGPDLTVYVHALRRHWLLAVGIGLLCAAVAGPAVYILIGVKYTSSSHLNVSMQENKLLQSEQVGTVDRDKFEIFKGTQVGKLTSRFVLRKAINKPEVARLPVIRQEVDPAEWLKDHLSIGFPGKAELMTVSLSRPDPKEAQTLVKAVVDSYISEVVELDAGRKRFQLSQLEKARSEREQDLRKKRETLQNMAEGVGGSGAEVMSTKQKLALEELQILRTHANNVQANMDTIKATLQADKIAQKTFDSTDVSSAEMNELVRTDPIINQIVTQLGEKQREQKLNQGVVKPGAKSAYIGHYEQDVDSLQRAYDERLVVIQKEAREKKRRLLDAEIVKQETMLKSLGQTRANTAKTVKKMTEEAGKYGVFSVAMEMLHREIAQMDLMQQQLSSEIEKLKVELDNAPRISVWEPADEPLAPSNLLIRIGASVLAMLASLCLPAALAIVLDMRFRRINTAQDVSQGLQLPVIGSVPLIPAKVIRQLGSPSPRHRVWHLRLTESVDGIAARLLHKADVEQSRVIMVSSATSGEGKTTLATQLALSLARTGRQVVLVDFDLRRPSFDEVFGVPLSPGVSETLRKENHIAELAHPTATDNLAVVTAGRWNRQTLAALSNGGVDAMFKQLRESFEFIVVDTSPILPVADARFVSKFVDTVVLSVFRDVSEAPKIQAACDILAAFGVRSVEAVVTGPGSDIYGKHTGYESTVSA